MFDGKIRDSDNKLFLVTVKAINKFNLDGSLNLCDQSGCYPTVDRRGPLTMNIVEFGSYFQAKTSIVSNLVHVWMGTSLDNQDIWFPIIVGNTKQRYNRIASAWSRDGSKNLDGNVDNAKFE